MVFWDGRYELATHFGKQVPPRTDQCSTPTQAAKIVSDWLITGGQGLCRPDDRIVRIEVIDHGEG